MSETTVDQSSLRRWNRFGTSTRSLVAVGLLWLGAGCGVPPERSSEGAALRETDPKVGEVYVRDARELASDTGISLEEAIEVIERQPQVGRLQAALKRHGPASFGGLFIDYVPEYQIVLLSLPGGADEVTRAVDELGFAELSPFTIARETPYTEDVLKHAMRMVADLGGTKLTSLDLDIRTGEILATAASSADVDAIRSAVAAADPAIPARRVIVNVPRGVGVQPGEASAELSAISVHPARVRVGDRAQLRVQRRAGFWGLGWILERKGDSSWEWVGNLKAGPGKRWRAEFFIGHAGYGVEDIGFTGPFSLTIEIPKLEAGQYRLGQEFIRRGREPVEERLEWHFAEFEVLE